MGKFQANNMTPEEECRAAWKQNGHLADLSRGKRFRARYLPPLSAAFVEVGSDVPLTEVVRIFEYRLEVDRQFPRGPLVGRVVGSHWAENWPMTDWQELR